MVTPETLGKPDALIFYSAEKTIFAIQKSVLNLMGTADFVGTDPGLAQLFSIGLLNILFTTTAAMLHSTALLQQAGIKPTDFQPYMNEFISGLPEMLDGMGKEVETGLYDGEMNNMNMMTAAMAHVARAIHDARLNPSLTDLMKNIMVKTVDKGYGRNGITSVIEVLRTPS